MSKNKSKYADKLLKVLINDELLLLLDYNSRRLIEANKSLNDLQIILTPDLFQKHIISSNELLLDNSQLSSYLIEHDSIITSHLSLQVSNLVLPDFCKTLFSDILHSYAEKHYSSVVIGGMVLLDFLKATLPEINLIRQDTVITEINAKLKNSRQLSTDEASLIVSCHNYQHICTLFKPVDFKVPCKTLNRNVILHGYADYNFNRQHCVAVFLNLLALIFIKLTFTRILSVSKTLEEQIIEIVNVAACGLYVLGQSLHNFVIALSNFISDEKVLNEVRCSFQTMLPNLSKACRQVVDNLREYNIESISFNFDPDKLECFIQNLFIFSTIKLKLLDNQLPIVSNLDIIFSVSTITSSAAVANDKIVHYYLSNNRIEKNIRELQTSKIIRQEKMLFNEAINNYHKGRYVLSCIELIILIDRVLVYFLNDKHSIRYSDNFSSLLKALPLPELINKNIDESLIIARLFLHDRERSIFADSKNLTKDSLNRNHIIHGVLSRTCDNVDFLKIFFALECMLSMSDYIIDT